jgi:hypothetical protein
MISTVSFETKEDRGEGASDMSNLESVVESIDEAYDRWTVRVCFDSFTLSFSIH